MKRSHSWGCYFIRASSESVARRAPACSSKQHAATRSHAGTVPPHLHQVVGAQLAGGEDRPRQLVEDAQVVPQLVHGGAALQAVAAEAGVDAPHAEQASLAGGPAVLVKPVPGSWLSGRASAHLAAGKDGALAPRVGVHRGVVHLAAQVAGVAQLQAGGDTERGETTAKGKAQDVELAAQAWCVGRDTTPGWQQLTA